MATDKAFVDIVMGQLSGLPGMSSRKMFGEYAVYKDGKVIGLICDNQLFIKPTDAGLKYAVDPVMASPYQGAKPHILIDRKHEQRDWLIGLVVATAKELELPKKKASRKS